MKNLSKLVVVLLSCYAFSVYGSDKTQQCTQRECLINLVDDYFSAMLAHDPSSLPFADHARFVENVERKPIGEGLWQSISAKPGSFKIYIADPVSHQVAFMGMIEENGQPVQIGLRLKLVDGLITEAEHVLARNLQAKNLPNLQTVRPGLLTTIPLSERMDRFQLLGVAYSYYDAVNLNDGSLAPFSKDCARRENGLLAANSGLSDDETDESPNYSALKCDTQLDTNMMEYIEDIDNIRVEVIDPVTGLVFGLSHFRHGMQKKEVPIYNMPGVDVRKVNYNAFDLPAAHVFKIKNSQLFEIEAMGFLAPYRALSGWE